MQLVPFFMLLVGPQTASESNTDDDNLGPHDRNYH